MRVETPEEIDMRDLGRVFTHIHDQESEISERFYLDFDAMFAENAAKSPCAAGIHNAMFLTNRSQPHCGGGKRTNVQYHKALGFHARALRPNSARN